MQLIKIYKTIYTIVKKNLHHFREKRFKFTGKDRRHCVSVVQHTIFCIITVLVRHILPVHTAASWDSCIMQWNMTCFTFVIASKGAAEGSRTAGLSIGQILQQNLGSR